MASTPTYRHDDADQLFGRVRPLMRSVLLQEYGLSRVEAAEICECLRIWFHGFFRRPGSPRAIERLRPHLLSMTCNVGHAYWSAKPAGEIPADNNVRRSLNLGPERLAAELERAVEDRERPSVPPTKGTA